MRAISLSLGAVALIGVGVTFGCASNCKDCATNTREDEAAAITPERLAMGKEAYQTGMCFKCHGPDGAGTKRAPNLTDGEWLHCDGSVTGILTVLNTGVPKSDLKDPNRPFGMNPATNLVPDEDARLALAQYVWSLSHPAAN